MQTGSIYGGKIKKLYKPRQKKFEEQAKEYFKKDLHLVSKYFDELKRLSD
jgi:hypothetical protein